MLVIIIIMGAGGGAGGVSHGLGHGGVLTVYMLGTVEPALTGWGLGM